MYICIYIYIYISGYGLTHVLHIPAGRSRSSEVGVVKSSLELQEERRYTEWILSWSMAASALLAVITIIGAQMLLGSRGRRSLSLAQGEHRSFIICIILVAI